MIALSTLPLPGPPKEKEASPTSGVPEDDQAIDLTWGQKISVSWSIMWPPFVVIYFLMTNLLSDDLLAYFVHRIPFVFSVIATASTLAGQAVLSFRMVRKNYRSFFIAVAKKGEPLERRLTVSQQVRISFWFLSPQVGLYFVGSALIVAAALAGVHLPAALNSLGIWLRILVLGPFGISCAMNANYRGFRLRAYRCKRKRDPRWSSIRSFRKNAERGDAQIEDDATFTPE